MFAFAQIRQLRASRQLAGFLEIVRAFHSPDIQAEQYRNELSSFVADTYSHPELLLREFWEYVGALMRHHVIDEPLFLDYFTVPCRLDWSRLEAVTELLRKENPYMSEEFEYVATLCDEWFLSRQRGADPVTRVRAVRKGG